MHYPNLSLPDACCCLLFFIVMIMVLSCCLICHALCVLMLLRFVLQGKRRCVRADQSEALIMAAIAETQTKGVRLPPGIFAELSAVTGGVELVTGLLAPSSTARSVIPISLSPQQQSGLENPPLAIPTTTSSDGRRQSISGSTPSATHLLKSPFFFGFDWISLRQGVMPAPFVPSPVELRALYTPTVGR